MKLIELLNNAEITKNKGVCIGTKRSSGFIYIGDDMQEAYNEVGRVIKNTWETKNSKIKELEKELLDLVKVNPGKDLGMALAYADSMSSLYSRMRKIYDYIETFKNLEERVVLEYKFKRSTDGRLCVIIEGSETSGFWTKEEYDNKKINLEDLEESDED